MNSSSSVCLFVLTNKSLSITKPQKFSPVFCFLLKDRWSKTGCTYEYSVLGVSTFLIHFSAFISMPSALATVTWCALTVFISEFVSCSAALTVAQIVHYIQIPESTIQSQFLVIEKVEILMLLHLHHTSAWENGQL